MNYYFLRKDLSQVQDKLDKYSVDFASLTLLGVKWFTGFLCVSQAPGSPKRLKRTIWVAKPEINENIHDIVLADGRLNMHEIM